MTENAETEIHVDDRELKKSELIVAGIDPGINGAIAFLFFDKRKNTKPYLLDIYPFFSEPAIEKIAFYKLIGELKVGVEKQWARPKTNVRDVTSIIYNYGLANGVLAAYGIESFAIPPATWKSFYGISSKRESVARFQEEFGEVQKCGCRVKLVKDHDRAESALLGLYTRQVFIR